MVRKKEKRKKEKKEETKREKMRLSSSASGNVFPSSYQKNRDFLQAVH